MFTGLIEEVGSLRGVSRQGEAMVLDISAGKVLEGARLGDSIAINGVCLTVTSFTSSSFTMDVTPQTYRHTNLKDLKPGDPVNLERAMAANGRFGGHIVQGHADGIAVLVSRQTEGNAVRFTFRLEEASLMRYIVNHGSITVDGISLTVAELVEDGFTVSIIPHTLKETALYHKQPGATVNIECDILGKYVEHLLRYGPRTEAGEQPGAKSRLTASFLTEHGFM
ncbi:riboflavin synthase [Paenibacillus sambharensis]|uniref:Riboflavin synthase n=1 Tax=Paenibacillus sambharensis TaxID=1803190 RepID=A0A2W1LFC2_9BACL|nr:riboflavin synthase [Paenibacillus sambharensis]PZD93732.1 riboflavin synthase [Paenibacillus sambharensis]